MSYVLDHWSADPFLIIAISVAYISGPSLWLVIVVVGVLSFTYPMSDALQSGLPETPALTPGLQRSLGSENAG